MSPFSVHFLYLIKKHWKLLFNNLLSLSFTKAYVDSTGKYMYQTKKTHLICWESIASFKDAMDLELIKLSNDATNWFTLNFILINFIFLFYFTFLWPLWKEALGSRSRLIWFVIRLETYLIFKRKSNSNPNPNPNHSSLLN